MCLLISAYQQCSDGCIGDRCDQLNGWCIHTCNSGRSGPFCCLSGFFGRYCNSICPSNCAICTSSDSCEECKNGLYGKTCVPCPEHCTRCLSNSSCSVCDDGYFGTMCTEQCSPGCIYNLCDKGPGTCSIGCRRNYNGPQCSECIRGYHGKDCIEECSHGCIDEVCLPNGTCTHGCKSDKNKGHTCIVKDGAIFSADESTESGIGNFVFVSLVNNALQFKAIWSRTPLQFLSPV